MVDNSSALHELMQTIEDRKRHPTPRSYTARLLAGGVDAIGTKLMEEAAEVVDAAGEAEEGEPGDGSREHMIHEAADLIYHLFVLLGHRDVGLHEVETELARRFGTSGLDEKESRP